MAQLTVKSGVKQLPLFQNQNFPYFEAYLRGDETEEELNQLANNKMKLVSLHLPSQVKDNNGVSYPLNFGDRGRAGESSYQALQKYISFANKHHVPYIVIHLGCYNCLAEERKDVLERIAGRFNQLETGGVKLCLENTPHWTNLCLENEPLFTEEKEWLFFKERCPHIGLVLDIDHVALDVVFLQFYDRLKQKYFSQAEMQDNHQIIEEEISRATRENPSFFQNKIEEALRQFLTAAKPDLIHAMGSDFCNYRLIESLPLVGESLPCGYRGKIKGYEVEDRLNHKVWISLLPKDIFVVLELFIRPEYDYVNQIKKDRQYLSRFF